MDYPLFVPRARCLSRARCRVGVVVACAVALVATSGGAIRVAAADWHATIAGAQQKSVKIHGAGGFRGLEAYQSGILISAEGHVLTLWSYVLDTEDVSVTLDDGRKFTAKLLGADPKLEIALLKIDAADLSHFELTEAAAASIGQRVLALSNVFGIATGEEAVSVQHGHVAAATSLAAHRGVFESTYRGPVYILDAMTNNPGSAGGALVALDGRLIGLLGKELRDSAHNVWLNYAMPVSAIEETVRQMLAGRFKPSTADEPATAVANSWSLEALGVVLVPDLVPRTPPFIDTLRRGSPAEQAGLLPDDLVLYINNRLVPSAQALRAELSQIDQGDELRLTVMRHSELIEVTLRVGAAPSQGGQP
ncbi:MAG: S1C family serine protease [Pirellulales bacterium]|nr:S1C family serine protease [Pirellulales bacterium]